MKPRWIEITALDLRAIHVVFYLSVLVLTLPIDFPAYSQIPAELYSPTPFSAWLGFKVADRQVLTVLTWLWRASLISSALGFFTLGARAVAFLLGFYLLTLDSQFGWVHRETIPSLLAMFVLLFAPVEKNRGAPAWKYSWPSYFILGFIVYLYFTAGFAKLRHAGWAWLDGETMLNHVIYARYVWFERLEAMHTVGVAPFVFGNVNARVIAVFIVFCELLSPLALLSATAAIVLVPLLMLTQISVYFLMGPNYLLNLPLLAFFLPWLRWRRLS